MIDVRPAAMLRNPTSLKTAKGIVHQGRIMLWPTFVERSTRSAFVDADDIHRKSSQLRRMLTTLTIARQPLSRVNCAVLSHNSHSKRLALNTPNTVVAVPHKAPEARAGNFHSHSSPTMRLRPAPDPRR